ncbi:MAG: polyhydroxyalkanoic acid system family protein [Gammaproteobacteria bacterium]|nr:polyhydroxyalkanoic acid system family protein [Gammaproteobacteria bacterium]
MAKISLTRAHQLGGEEVHRRVDALAQKLVTRFGGHYQWHDASVRYQRAGGVDAVIECGAENIRIDVTLGPLAGFLRDTIERELNAALDSHLDG